MTAVAANIDKCKAWEKLFECIHRIVCENTSYIELHVLKNEQTKTTMKYNTQSIVMLKTCNFNFAFGNSLACPVPIARNGPQVNGTENTENVINV